MKKLTSLKKIILIIAIILGVYVGWAYVLELISYKQILFFQLDIATFVYTAVIVSLSYEIYSK
ncbi:MAG: hypothetical protein WC472_01765 [Candidatus Paceibacterota bacterium]